MRKSATDASSGDLIEFDSNVDLVSSNFYALAFWWRAALSSSPSSSIFSVTVYDSDWNGVVPLVQQFLSFFFLTRQFRDRQIRLSVHKQPMAARCRGFQLNFEQYDCRDRHRSVRRFHEFQPGRHSPRCQCRSAHQSVHYYSLNSLAANLACGDGVVQTIEQCDFDVSTCDPNTCCFTSYLSSNGTCNYTGPVGN
jgi:hypothetical protein